jgi:hypothetical protein
MAPGKAKALVRRQKIGLEGLKLNDAAAGLTLRVEPSFGESQPSAGTGK